MSININILLLLLWLLSFNNIIGILLLASGLTQVNTSKLLCG